MNKTNMYSNTVPILDTLQKKKLGWLVDHPIDTFPLKD